MKPIKTISATVLGLALCGTASAGPFILDLTDADDHGFVSGTTNQDGWFYMQRVLENLAPGVTNGNKLVVSLGSTDFGSSFGAYAAANSAFTNSSLSGSGWTWTNIDGGALTGFFDGTGPTTINDAGIITIDSGNNVSGGITSSELAVLNANASLLDTFLGGGGALHSLAQAGSGQYGWLSTLLPGLTFETSGGSGSLALTSAGSSAFPGLSDSDLNAGPFHGHWTGGFGGLTQLFVDTNQFSNFFNDPVGIGSSGGSVTDPTPPAVPAPAPLTLLGIGLLALGMARRRVA